MGRSSHSRPTRQLASALRRAGETSLALLALLVPELRAQEVGLRVDRLSVEDGLSHSVVRTIFQDARGFLWLGTQEGLNRYDGYRFKVYKNAFGDPDSLAESEVYAIHEDRAGELWIGTRGGGLDRFDRATERFEHFRHDPADPKSLSHDVVPSIFEDRDGTLWVAAGDSLNRFHRADATFTRYRLPATVKGNTIYTIYEDSAGMLAVGTSSGLIRFDRRTASWGSFGNDLDDLHGGVRSILEDRAGQLWLGTQATGLYRFDRQTQTLSHYRHDPTDPRSLSHDSMAGLCLDQRGEIWIATVLGGLNRYDPASDGFVHFRHDPSDPESLSTDSLSAVYEDRDGNLWIGTHFGGVNKYDRGRDRFLTFRHQSARRPTLASSRIWAVLEDGSGTLWVGSIDHGLDRIDRRQGSITHYHPDPDDLRSLPDPTISALLEDRSGILWIGTQRGLSRFDRATESFTNYRYGGAGPSGPPSDHDRIVSLLEDGAGGLWVGTFAGLSRFDRETGRFVTYPEDSEDPHELGRAWVYSMLEDRSGALWLGTTGHGLYRLDRVAAAPDAVELVRYLQDLSDPRSLSSNKVAALAEDQAGNLWIGTLGGGLNRLRPEGEGFTQYHEQDGLASDSVLGILEDDRRNLWLSTNRGLTRFDPESETFTNYDAADGLQDNVFNLGSSFRGRSGELFFGGARGLNAFFPDRITRDLRIPAVVITDFRLLNQPVPLRRMDAESPLERSIVETTELVLSHREDVFSLEFAALHYASPDKNRYAYRLEGFDEEWISVDADQRSATYTNLDAGRYVFRVKGSNKDGAWNEEGASLRITVLPPLWRTWWAYALYALALAAVVWGYVRSHREELRRERQISLRLREVDKLKDEFLANTSHELRTPLYGMTGLAESLIDGATGELPEATKSNLAMLVHSGRRLSALVDDILDFSKLKHHSLDLDLKPVDLHPLVDVVLALSRPLAGGKQLDLENAVAADLPAVLADENRLQQVLHNLVGNAVKFTEAGEVEVAATERDGRVTVSVRDTGVGIPQEQQKRIFEAFTQVDASIERELGGTGLGLAVSHQLIDLHGGSLCVESAPGEGATFFFDLEVCREPAGVTASPRIARVVAGEAASDPALRLGEEAAVAESASVSTGSASGGASASLLVVDDEPVIRQVVSNQLSAHGFRVTIATGGEEALRLLAERVVDLVILDVMMPRMSGFEVCRKLRERYPLEELPVIFLTARNRAEDLVVGLAAGANDYLPKPVSKSELLARVQTHVALLRVNRQLAGLVSERTSQLSERERLLAERERLIGQLEARNAELARFNYTVAHDLKNPLITIRNFIGVLERDVEAGNHGHLLRDLRRVDDAASTLHRLLEELDQFSRAGHAEVPCEEVAFAELVDHALAELAPVVTERGIAIEVARDLPTVCGDRARLLEAVRHLLTNAVQYLGEQPAPRVEVSTRQDGSEAVMFVRDNGQGIDAKFHRKIFGLFERLAPQASEGTGIGLALVKRTVEVHGGRIWVESEGRGRGSTFCFTLPRPAEGEQPGRRTGDHRSRPVAGGEIDGF